MTWPFPIVPAPVQSQAAVGINFYDPRRLMRMQVSQAALFDISNAGVRVQNTTATFWINLALAGVNVDTNFTASTYKTLLSASPDQGRIASIVGPIALGAGETTTALVTSEFGAYEISVALTSGYRMVLGNISNGAAVFSTSVLVAPLAITSAKNIVTVDNTAYLNLGWENSLSDIATPCLQYNTFISVQIKHSANVTSTTNNERQSGVVYMSQT